MTSGRVQIPSPPGVFCKNHPEVLAAGYCAGCAEPFCNNCLVDIQGQRYCGSCKQLPLQRQPVVEAATMACKEAHDALMTAILGLFCFGIILEPLAISKASKAKKMIAANPRLTGEGKANAALIIGVIGLILWLLGLIARISGVGK